jgi:hypothetical protein
MSPIRARLLSCLSAFLAVLSLSGCIEADVSGAAPVARAGVILDYANTSLGFRNSGALNEGRLMLWDRQENTISDLRTDIPLTEIRATAPATLNASGVNGFALSGGAMLGGQVGLEIAAAVSNQIAIAAVDAVRVTTSDGVTAVTDAFRRSTAAGEDPQSAWQIDSALAERERYRYVLLVDPVRAGSESVAFANEQSAASSVTLIDTALGQVSVSLPHNVSASCRAAGSERATCFINAIALSVFQRRDGQPGFRSVGYSRAELSAALRAQ